jgi:glycosyltransferase involved in cell wall biosynthesis
VALPGFVANPYAWMSRAALLALSSVWEALPTVLIEALACGTPVVATDCPSGPCEILDGGRFGRLVPVGDPEALAGAIDATLDRPADPEQSRRRAQDFAVGPITEHYLDALLGH